MNESEYLQSLFVKKDPEGENILQSLKDHEIPNISVPPETGVFLTLLVKITNAKNVLEFGALGGYSALHLLRGLPEDGRLLSLETREEYVKLASSNLEKAGYNGRFQHILGFAKDSLEKLERDGETFDLFFIDADKANYINYLDASIRLAHSGSLIIADNALRGGRVYDLSHEENATKYMREFNKYLSEHPQLDAFILPVGDGVAIARIK